MFSKCGGGLDSGVTYIECSSSYHLYTIHLTTQPTEKGLQFFGSTVCDRLRAPPVSHYRLVLYFYCILRFKTWAYTRLGRVGADKPRRGHVSGDVVEFFMRKSLEMKPLPKGGTTPTVAVCFLIYCKFLVARLCPRDLSPLLRNARHDTGGFAPPTGGSLHLQHYYGGPQ